jgi:hypothetical protein
LLTKLELEVLYNGGTLKMSWFCGR